MYLCLGDDGLAVTVCTACFYVVLLLCGLHSLLLSWYANYRKETTTLAQNHLAAELAWARDGNSAKLRRPVVGCRRRGA